jgi:hypothetical protein
VDGLARKAEVDLKTNMNESSSFLIVSFPSIPIPREYSNYKRFVKKIAKSLIASSVDEM